MKDKRTYNIIGGAMEVHKELGCGFLEAVYQEALEREFISQRIPFESKPIVEIEYKGKPLEKDIIPILSVIVPLLSKLRLFRVYQEMKKRRL